MSTPYLTLEEFRKRHGYEIDNIWYPRVTSIVSIKAKPFLDRFLNSLPDKANGEAIKIKSAEEGTLIHDTIEGYLKREPVAIPDAIKPAMTAFFDFASRHSIVPHRIEERIVSKKHLYSGTVDVLAELDGELGVLDIKTSGAIYRDYGLQTAAYVEAFQEKPDYPLLTRWILRVDQNQKCLKCSATLRLKGGNYRVKGEKYPCEHEWSETQGHWELKELKNLDYDIKAFLACKTLWEWEHEYFLKKLR